MTALFYGAAAVAVAASALAVTRSHALHALLYLVVALLAVSLAFLALGAPLLAALEVIVYAGAILVLVLFVIMMLDPGPEGRRQERRWLAPRHWVLPGLLAGTLGALTLRALALGRDAPVQARAIGPHAVGRSLFTDYLVGVELASILLLVGLVGAVYLGSRR